MRELSHSRRRIAAATLNGRLPITLTGESLTSSAKSIARKSALTTRMLVKRSWSRSARRGSSSTSVSERRGRATIFSVRMPRPGPISTTASDSDSCAAATIRSATPALVRKFCPRDFAGRTPARANAGAGRDGVSTCDFRAVVTCTNSQREIGFRVDAQRVTLATHQAVAPRERDHRRIVGAVF